MAQVFKGRTSQTWKTLFGSDVFAIFGEINQPAVQYTVIGLTFWLVCFWLYRQKIFLRV